jgi:hypothetical protein
MNIGMPACSIDTLIAVVKVCRIHGRVEHGEACRAEQEEKRQIALDHMPVATKLRQADCRYDRDGKRPAQRRQQHRRDVTDGQLARDGVAAPEQGGQKQEEICVAEHRCGRPERNTGCDPA